MRRHEVDPVSLTFGLIFLGIANAWLMVATGASDVAGLRWFFPALLLGAGGAGMISSLLRERRPRDRGAAGDPMDAGDPTDAVDTGDLVDTPEGQP